MDEYVSDLVMDNYVSENFIQCFSGSIESIMKDTLERKVVRVF
jgi:hypothetical protein